VNSITDPFEPTPEGFHRRVEQKLNELQRAHAPVRRAYRRIAVFAFCLVMVCGTALALRQFGVLDFLTTRIAYAPEVAEKNVVSPISQRCDSNLLAAEVQDAYWDGETLSVSVHVKPADDSYAFYMETDVGTDGERFDHIWWNGEILPLAEWLNGRQAIMLYLPKMTIDGLPAANSWDWVANEQGKTLLVQTEADDMTRETTLTIRLRSVIADTDTAE